MLNDSKTFRYDCQIAQTEYELEGLMRFVSKWCNNDPSHISYPHDEIRHLQNRIRNLKALKAQYIERNS